MGQPAFYLPFSLWSGFGESAKPKLFWYSTSVGPLLLCLSKEPILCGWNTYHFIFISVGSRSQVWSGGPWGSFRGPIKSKLFSCQWSTILFQSHSRSQEWAVEFSRHYVTGWRLRGSAPCVLGFQIFSVHCFYNFLWFCNYFKTERFKTSNTVKKTYIYIYIHTHTHMYI